MRTHEFFAAVFLVLISVQPAYAAWDPKNDGQLIVHPAQAWDRKTQGQLIVYHLYPLLESAQLWTTLQMMLGFFRHRSLLSSSERE